MIYGNRTIWMTKRHPHRDIRMAASGIIDHSSLIGNWRWLGEKPNLDDYFLSVENYFHHLIGMYETSFDENYRRRSNKINFDITPGLDVKAVTFKEDYSKICISLGTLLAIEDASHSYLSDSHCPLGLNSTEVVASDREVLHIENFKLFDRFRYYNYNTILESIRGEGISGEYKLFPLGLFKFMSRSKYRQEVADILSTLSIMWVLNHEDAHNYHGHLSYFEKCRLGVAGEEVDLSFSETEYNDIFGETAKKVRRAVEFEADTSACMRLVDHFCDAELIELFPVLKNNVNIYSNELVGKGFTKSQINFFILLRICIIAPILSISVTERSVIKNNNSTAFYPTFLERVFNIIVTSYNRAINNSSNYPHYNISEPFGEDQVILFFNILIKDIQVLTRTILSNGVVLYDPDMYDSRAVEASNIVEDEMFSSALIHTIMWKFYGSGKYSFENGKLEELFRGILINRCNYHNLLVRELQEEAYQANPQNIKKTQETHRSYKEYEVTLRERFSTPNSQDN